LLIHIFINNNLSLLPSFITSLSHMYTYHPILYYFILFKCTAELIPCITILINSFFNTESMIGVKKAHVRPLLKKAGLDHNICNNYRPICNLTFISKHNERVVLKRLNVHMKLNNLNIDCQLGSVLGPVLFNIYTRSLHKLFTTCGFNPSGYADYNKITAAQSPFPLYFSLKS